MEIKYSAKSFERFKRVARRKSPVEYLELLFGHEAGGAFELVKTVKVKHTATVGSDDDPVSCDCDEKDFEYQVLKIEKEGLVYLGTIHSHPNREENHASEDDNKNAIAGEEKIFGIYSFLKSPTSGRVTHSKLCFYRPQLPMAKAS